MRRYWVESDQIHHNFVMLDGEVYHHIVDVCRQDVGSKFEILNDQGNAFFVEIVELNKKSAKARILEERKIPSLPRPFIRLYLSIPKFQTFESIIEKAVELGVYDIQPFYSQFSFVRTGESISLTKKNRWEKIVTGATQQTGRGSKMQIHSPQPLVEVLKTFNRSDPILSLVGYEGETEVGIKEFLQSKQPVINDLSEIRLFIGSEGGFSPAEIGLLKENNINPITVGSQVLRVETACIALVSALKYELGFMK